MYVYPTNIVEPPPYSVASYQHTHALCSYYIATYNNAVLADMDVWPDHRGIHHGTLTNVHMVADMQREERHAVQ